MTYVDPNEIDRSPQHPVRRAFLMVTRVVTFLVYVYVSVVQIILLLGFLLLLLGANPSSSFVAWVYRSLERTMRPFRGIFEPIELGTTGNDVPSVFETSVLFAMVVYAIVALVLHALLEWLKSRLARLDREDALYQQEQLARLASRPPEVPQLPTAATPPPASGSAMPGGEPPPAAGSPTGVTGVTSPPPAAGSPTGVTSPPPADSADQVPPPPPS